METRRLVAQICSHSTGKRDEKTILVLHTYISSYDKCTMCLRYLWMLSHPERHLVVVSASSQHRLSIVSVSSQHCLSIIAASSQCQLSIDIASSQRRFSVVSTSSQSRLNVISASSQLCLRVVSALSQCHLSVVSGNDSFVAAQDLLRSHKCLWLLNTLYTQLDEQVWRNLVETLYLFVWRGKTQVKYYSVKINTKVQLIQE